MIKGVHMSHGGGGGGGWNNRECLEKSKEEYNYCVIEIPM